MRPPQPRTVTVSITTYVATTVVLVLWLLAAVAVALYLFFYQRKRAQTAQRTSSWRSMTRHSPPNDLTALPAYPQRPRTPSYPPSGPSSFSATTRPINFSPVRTPPNADPVAPRVPTKTEDTRRTTTVSPTRNRVPAPPSISEATQLALLANNPAQAAESARLQCMPLASDTTDTSTETVGPGKEVLNAAYVNRVAQSGLPLTHHAMVGSDDSTDAGDGNAAALTYAMHARGRGTSAWRVDPGRYGGRCVGQGGRGRAMTFEQGTGGEELDRMRPLQVRKMSSM